jgi:putative transposase
MLHLTLTDADRAAVRAARHDPTIRPRERDRVEMVLLSDTGWSVPRIAAHLACHPATVRGVLKRFVAGGPASLRRAPPGPPPDTARREQIETALGTLLDEDRTWTAAQLAAALTEQHGIALSVRQIRKYLGRIAAWRRTVRSLRHKQDPAKAERAAHTLERLEAKRPSAVYGSSISTSVASAPASR